MISLYKTVSLYGFSKYRCLRSIKSALVAIFTRHNFCQNLLKPSPLFHAEEIQDEIQLHRSLTELFSMLNDISDEAPIDEDEQTTTDVDYADLGDQLTDEVLAVLTLMPEELDLDLDNITKGWI